jgi:hypothetical protein
MADNSVLYTAVYTNLEDAKFDLEAFEQLHKDHLIGKFDAAVIDKEDGKPPHRQTRGSSVLPRDPGVVRIRHLAAQGAP